MASIDKSYEFLLMSSHFGSFETNREGFKKLYRKLSDKTWENAIDVIKYIAQRGGSMNFMEPPRLNNPVSITWCSIQFKLSQNRVYKRKRCHCCYCSQDDLDGNTSESKVFELIELDSLAKALDNEKKLVSKALYIHKEAQHQVNKIDAGVAHYIEEHLIEPLSDSVRQLAGYTNDLKNMLTVHEHNDARGVAIFLFDEYLSKSL